MSTSGFVVYKTGGGVMKLQFSNRHLQIFDGEHYGCLESERCPLIPPKKRGSSAPNFLFLKEIFWLAKI